MKKYSGTTLDKCLKQASEELKKPMESLKYEIIEETKGFFKKTFTIMIKDDIKETKDEANNNGFIEVINEKLVVTDPVKDGKPAKLLPRDNMIIKINGEELLEPGEVYSNSEVEISLIEQQAKRYINVDVSKDQIEAYVTIKYMPHIIYSLEDMEAANKSRLSTKIIKEEFPSKFTLQEVSDYLKQSGITTGIIRGNVEKLLNDGECSSLLIAKGEAAVDDIPDTIDIKFKSSVHLNYQDNSLDRVNYKDMCAVESVKKGDILAILNKGVKGKNGITVQGKVINKKEAKQVLFKAGKGTELVDDITIAASIPGKPSFKNGFFEVNEVYELKSDVNVNTGSVKFNGAVKVFGAVNEGMKVEATGDIEILGGIDSAHIYSSQGNISIMGNILRSKITAGGTDTEKINTINLYKELASNMNDLISAVEEIKKFNLLGKNISDGQVIKILLENKFKGILRTSEAIIALYKQTGNSEEAIEKYIRFKIMGLTPLTIKHYGELTKFIDILNYKINELKVNISIPVNTTLNYCQDSEINCSGDIVFLGKGEYQSYLKAGGSIYFQPGSVVRGGTLSAEREIRCNTVGSPGGVATKLHVSKGGHIYAETAYQNTYFSIGEKETILDIPSKKVHVFIDDAGLIVIDRFNI